MIDLLSVILQLHEDEGLRYDLLWSDTSFESSINGDFYFITSFWNLTSKRVAILTL